MSTYDWQRIQALRLEGKTWDEVAYLTEQNVDTSTSRRVAARIRKAYSRHGKMYIEGLQAYQDGEYSEAPYEDGTREYAAWFAGWEAAAQQGAAQAAAQYENMSRAVQTEGMKILGIDIETAPHTAYVWGFYQQFIDPKNVERTGRVMCWSARWYSHPDAPVVFVSEHKHGHEETIRRAHALLDEADAVVHYNGSRFDIPTLNSEFLRYGMRPPSPYAEVDLLKVTKKRFRFSSNKLDYVLRELGLGQKVDHRGFKLWVQCMAGDAEAWAEMEKYNRGDVTEMEKLYKSLLPWISNHPNHALYQQTDRPACPNCGGSHLHSKGYARTKTQQYKRYQCQDCGTHTRERYTAVEPDKRKHILTQVV